VQAEEGEEVRNIPCQEEEEGEEKEEEGERRGV